MSTADALRHAQQGKPGVVGATIVLYSGEYFDFERPEDSPINIVDIAHGLSNICRFGGQARAGFYSVAQHSVLVSHAVPPEHAFAALMHDAAEAYVGDMVGPLKALCPDYKAIEKRVEAAVFARFGIALPLDPCVKHADLRLLRTEQRDLTSGAGDAWNGLDAYQPLSTPISPMRPGRAMSLFLTRFNELTSGALCSFISAEQRRGSALTDLERREAERFVEDELRAEVGNIDRRRLLRQTQTALSEARAKLEGSMP